MPENEQPVEAYSAADAYKTIEGHTSELPVDPDEDEQERPEPEGEKPADGEDEEEAGEHAEEPEDERETDETESKDSEDDVPSLDPLLEELAKGNPKAEKRIHEIAQGLEKLKTETKELKSLVEKAKPQVEFLEKWNDALGSPETAGPAIVQLIKSVASHYSLDPRELLTVNGEPFGGKQTGESAPPELLPAVDEYGRAREQWEREGYASPKEKELDLEIRSLKSSLLTFGKEREALAKEREESAKQAEFKAMVDEIAPRTIAKLEKLENGWKVTKAMVEKAIREFPQLKDDPARAVKAAFTDELKKHYASASRPGKPRGHEMPEGTRGKGMSVPDPGRFSAKDALALIEG